MHGGGPPVVAGRPLDQAYKAENVELVRAGCCNLEKHVRNMRAYGVPVVVALNRRAGARHPTQDVPDSTARGAVPLRVV